MIDTRSGRISAGCKYAESNPKLRMQSAQFREKRLQQSQIAEDPCRNDVEFSLTRLSSRTPAAISSRASSITSVGRRETKKNLETTGLRRTNSADRNQTRSLATQQARNAVSFANHDRALQVKPVAGPLD